MDDLNRMVTTIKGNLENPADGTGTNFVDNPETNKEPSYADYRYLDSVPNGTTMVPQEQASTVQKTVEESKLVNDIVEVRIERSKDRS